MILQYNHWGIFETVSIKYRPNKDNSIWGKNWGSGGNSSRNRVRVPSKKRSKRVWVNFHTMFPNHTPKDMIEKYNLKDNINT